MILPVRGTARAGQDRDVFGITVTVRTAPTAAL